MNGVNPNLGPILKVAFVMAVLIYLGVALAIAGPPRWNAPWIPGEAPASTLAIVLPVLAFGALVAGFLLSRRPAPDPLPETAPPWLVTRFVLGAAATESGAILMLMLSLLAKDSRWAILGALPAAAVLILAPVSAGDGTGSSG